MHNILIDLLVKRNFCERNALIRVFPYSKEKQWLWYFLTVFIMGESFVPVKLNSDPTTHPSPLLP